MAEKGPQDLTINPQYQGLPAFHHFALTSSISWDLGFNVFRVIKHLCCATILCLLCRSADGKHLAGQENRTLAPGYSEIISVDGHWNLTVLDHSIHLPNANVAGFIKMVKQD